MKLEYLNEFVVLAETLSFSKSAKVLGISQPVLSTHIKALETALGIQLVTRDQHGVRLDKAGQIIYEKSADLLIQYSDMLEALSDYKNSISSTLIIGYLYNAFKDILPKAAGEFTNEHPNIKTRMRSLSYEKLCDDFLNDKIDLALTLDVDEPFRELCYSKTLSRDRISCVVRSDDPLASESSLSLMDLQTEAFILPSPKHFSGFYRFYKEMFCKAGFTPNIAMYYQEIETRHLDIVAGAGIALVGNHFKSAMGESLKFIPLREDYCYYDLIVLWKKTNQNFAIPSFLELLKTL